MNQFLPINSLGNQTDRPVTVARAPWEAAEAPQAQVRPKGSDDTPMERWAPTPRLRAAVKPDPDMNEAYYAAALKMQAAKDGHMGMLPTFPGSKPTGNRGKGQKVTVLSVIRDHGPCTTAVVAKVMGRSIKQIADRVSVLKRAGQVRTVGKDGYFAIYEAVK